MPPPGPNDATFLGVLLDNSCNMKASYSVWRAARFIAFDQCNEKEARLICSGGHQSAEGTFSLIGERVFKRIRTAAGEKKLIRVPLK